MSVKKPIHLLVRFSDNFASIGDVISEHQEVIRRKKSVWFGKLGKSVSETIIETINQQCKEGIPSYLFLAKGNRRKTTFYKAIIISLTSTLPEKELKLIPVYYFDKKIAKSMKFWAKLSNISPIDSKDIQKVKVANSANDIEESLFRSSSGHFIIEEISK